MPFEPPKSPPKKSWPLPGTYDDGAGPYTLDWGIEREGPNAERPASVDTGRPSKSPPNSAEP